MNFPFKEYLNLGKIKQKTPDPEEAAARDCFSFAKMMIHKIKKIFKQN